MSKSAVCNQPALESLEGRLLLSGGISGTVIDVATSQPVGGLTLYVYESSNPNSANGEAWDWVTSVQTNAQGQYFVNGLDPRHYRVQLNDGAASSGTHFVQADLYDVVVFDGATTTSINIQAREAGKIAGHVYDTAGHPIPNVEVLIDADYTREDGDSGRHTAITDANGQYDIYVLATSQKIYPVKIYEAPTGGTSPGGHPTHYAAQVASGLYAASPDGTAGPDFHLSLGGSIHGFAVTSDGAPVVGMDVLDVVQSGANGVIDETGYPWTDANGEFWLDGLPAGTDIYLDTDNGNWNDFSSNGHMYAQSDRYVGPFNVAAGQVLDIAMLTVSRAGGIRGVVTDAAGNPIVGADVNFRGMDAKGGNVNSNNPDSITTDALGQYRCDWLVPAQYTVKVTKDGWVQYTSAATVTVTADQVVQQDVVLKPSAGGVQVSGTITNFTDFALKNSDGVVLPYSILSYDGYMSDNGPEGPIVLAFDANRQFTSADMVKPELVLSGQADVTDGYQNYFAPSATPAGHYTMTLATGSQSLQAMGPVKSQTSGGWWSGVLSDPVTVNGTAGQSITKAFTIPEGTATISGNITFPAGYGNGGHPISDGSALLFLRPVTGNNSVWGRAVGQADPAGHFVLADIPAGSYYLYSYGFNLTPWISGVIHVAAGQAVVQNVAMGYGGVVSGTVTSGGSPVAGATVGSRNSGFSAVTDQSGNYQLPGFLVGGDTLTVSKAGLASQNIDVTLAANEHKTQNVSLVGSPSSITGLVERTDTTFVNGATVVAYNSVTGQQVSTTTVAGQFTFTGLASGQYVLGVHADGMTTATYPGGAGTIAVNAAAAVDLSATPIILSDIGPTFSMSSSVASGILNITFHTDMALNSLPTITLVSGAGDLGLLSQVNTTTFTCAYTPAAGESLARIRIAEDAADPIIAGSAVSKTFGFDVAATLVEQQGTTFYNAQGAAADMMGAQDNSNVYVPPFALAGGDATSAITLTATRYGDPGAPLGNSTAVTGVYDFSFSKDGQAADVHLAHQATVTLSFKLPDGMTPTEFEATLKVGFNNKSINPPAWVWNDMANSNPASGISDIAINWGSNSITFKASHFTEFAATAGAGANDLVVTLGPLPVYYRDADGTEVLVTIKGGTAGLQFTGGGLGQHAEARRVVVTADSDLKLQTITLVGTNGVTSQLTFTTKGGATAGTTIGEITGTPLSKLNAKTISLDGQGIAISAGAITTIQVASLSGGADIILGAPLKPVSITCGAIGSDTAISLGGWMKALTATSWAGGSLSADKLDKLKVVGDLSNLAMSVGGAVGSVQARSWEAGSLTAGSVATLTLNGVKTPAGLVGGNMRAAMTLNGPAGTVLLKKATIAGALGGAATIHGNAGTIKLGALRAGLTIDGTTSSLTLVDSLALSSPQGGSIGQVHVGGAAKITAGGQKIACSNADLFARTSADLYRMDDLYQIRTDGATWDYDANIVQDRKVQPPMTLTMASGSGLATINGKSSATMEVRNGGNVVARTSWYNEGGRTNMSSWMSDSDFGLATMYFDGSLGVPDWMQLKQKYSTTSAVHGTWNIEVDDQPVLADAIGSAAMTVQLLGHEMIPGTATLAAKLQCSMTITGTFTYTQDGVDHKGKFSITEKQTLWCRPGEGIIRAIRSLAQKGSITGKGSGSENLSLTMNRQTE